MKTTQYFTGHGILGVVCCFVGPAIFLTGIYRMTGNAYGPGTFDMVLMSIGAFLAIAALPLMLIGREYSSRD